jgi:hypothetical protein
MHSTRTRTVQTARKLLAALQQAVERGAVSLDVLGYLQGRGVQSPG